MSGLDYVALRYFNVYGPRMDVHGLYTEVLVRWMERIADGQPPLILGDGAQTMDFVYVEDIARANILAAWAPTCARASSTSPAGAETSLLGLAEALLRVMGSDLGVEHGPDRAVNGVTSRLADTSAARRDLGLGGEDRPRRGPARARRLVAPAARGHRRGPDTRCGGVVTRINVMKPWLGAEEVAAVAAVVESGWVAQGPRVAEFEAAFAAADRTRRTRSRCRRCTTGAPPRARRGRRRPGRRGRRAVAVVHRHGQRRPLRRRDAGVRRRRPGDRATSPPTPIEPALDRPRRRP